MGVFLSFAHTHTHTTHTHKWLIHFFEFWTLKTIDIYKHTQTYTSKHDTHTHTMEMLNSFALLRYPRNKTSIQTSENKNLHKISSDYDESWCRRCRNRCCLFGIYEKKEAYRKCEIFFLFYFANAKLYGLYWNFDGVTVCV